MSPPLHLHVNLRTKALAQRRFVLVTVGVFAALYVFPWFKSSKYLLMIGICSLFSFLPPSTTLRRYQRTSLATTVSEIGSIYCSIVSFANSRQTENTQEIVQSLIAIRAKLKRSLVLKTNIIYEVRSGLMLAKPYGLTRFRIQFSMRGSWPAERYHKVLDQQLCAFSPFHELTPSLQRIWFLQPRQIAYLLSHLMSVVQSLEPAWNRAFLRRTRFLDADFQGDVLAVISQYYLHPV